MIRAGGLIILPPFLFVSNLFPAYFQLDSLFIKALITD